MDRFPCHPQECRSFKSDWCFSNKTHNFLYANCIYVLIIFYKCKNKNRNRVSNILLLHRSYN